MYHHLAVHIDQPSSDVSKLLEEMIPSVTGTVYSRAEPHKLKTVRIPVHLDELGDISIGHPFRHHHELVIAHHHSQQWQYVLMAKSFPRDDFLAESLCCRHLLVNTCASTTWKTHSCDLNKVARYEYLQNLDCNLDPFMFALPYFSESALISRGFRPIVAEWDLH